MVQRFWEPIDYSPPGSSVHRISQARVLEWVAISLFRGSSQTQEPIGRQILYHWATREDPKSTILQWKIKENKFPIIKSIYLKYPYTSTCQVTLVVSDSLKPYGLWPTRILSPWDSPDRKTGVGCHFLLQEIFPTQGSNLGLLHYRQILYHLSYQGSP